MEGYGGGGGPDHGEEHEDTARDLPTRQPLTKRAQKEDNMTDDGKPAVSRTSAGLRDAIFDELEALRRGESNPTRANAVAKLAGSVVETVRMELEVQKHIRSTAQKATVVSDGDGGWGAPLKLAG